jgi:hypothetical protein
VREQALLPLTRSSAADKTCYTEFIEKFGTHYVSSAVFGTSLETMVMSSMSVVSTHSRKHNNYLSIIDTFVLSMRTSRSIGQFKQGPCLVS